MKALMIICTFNEGVKLENTAERVYQALIKRKEKIPIDILIADDGSTDGAPERLSKKYGFLLIRHDAQKGVGCLIRDAYFFGLEGGYNILMTMAGNNKDEPDQFDRLLDPITEGQADFVQGSRYLSGGEFGNMPFYRRVSTRYVHPLLFSLVAGKKITDSTNGFRAVHERVLKDARINLSQNWLDHYELEPYLFCQAIWLGYKVQEVPVTKIYPDKALGYSKMKPITGWWSILRPIVYLAFKLSKERNWQ